MCFILFVMGIYNYVFVKWLDVKFKFLLVNENIIIDIFVFINEICGVKINLGEILVFYDVLLFFINVFLDEIIDILVYKVFENNWFNDIYGLNLIRIDFIDFLYVVIKG